MKAYFNVNYLYAASILLLLFIFSACSTTRFLEENQAIVRKVELAGIDKQFSEQAYIYIQQDIKPNSRLNLGLYNLFNTKNGKYRTDRIKNIGEAPHILDTPLVEISRNEVEKFLKTKGFLKAEVKSKIKVERKKAYITFSANPGPAFKLRNYTYTAGDSAVKNIYEQNRASFTKLSPGMRYDEDSLKNESKQLFDVLKRKGYYDYLQQYMRGFADSNLNSSQVDVKMIIDNPPNRDKHQVYKINNTSFRIRNSEGRLGRSRRPIDSAVLDSQYYFKDHSGRFKFNILSKYIFFEKYDLFDIDKRDLTYDRLYDLNIFKNVEIDFVKRKDDTTALDVTIEATPLKRMSNRIEGEYTFNSGRNGFNIANTYTNRNLFRGAEQLDIKFRYGVLFDSRLSGRLWNRVFSRDIQIGANLVFPKLLSPFPIPSLGRHGVPRTTISSSLQLFDQPGSFSNRLFINSITYNWVETRYKLHSLTPISIEYRDGRLETAFRDTLDSLGYQLYIITNDRRYVNLGTQYSFTLNNIRLNTYENFIYFRTFVDMGGNTLALLANTLKLPKDSNGDRTLFGLPYLQYAKTEFDFRIYRTLGGERQFIARLNPGIAYPFGNSRELPFERNFYAGGSTGIRAWQARTLGPGNYDRAFLEDADTRRKFTNLDQFGEIKLEGNLEYRFKIIESFFGSKVKGATFVDFGNVWRLNELALPNRDIESNAQLKLNRLFKQIAIGTGAGLRFDLQYFVFRFDVGIKLKDPQFGDGDQWVIKHLFKNNEFKEQYYQTHNPDRYRFLQYNFGIGMPF
ncbi:translocation and assembly module lipoprotein TamL [Desertivirga xinjiangensis]|uniref:translocation and assembly module lipoprotein TamL n=1 Tax=Desertivirga xinjiangensis TaxID=539206 RepID=UPI00210E4AB4|nr:BamA/TamA family outer membrane protein [Pedobacter xinjiangensis]